MNPDALIAAASQWLGVLPGLMTGTAQAITAWNQIRAALQANGLAADTAQLDLVIADAAARKAREDRILDGGE